MIPQRVKLSGFLSYKDEQEVRFDGSPCGCSRAPTAAASRASSTPSRSRCSATTAAAARTPANSSTRSATLTVEFDFLLESNSTASSAPSGNCKNITSKSTVQVMRQTDGDVVGSTSRHGPEAQVRRAGSRTRSASTTRRSRRRCCCSRARRRSCSTSTPPGGPGCWPASSIWNATRNSTRRPTTKRKELKAALEWHRQSTRRLRSAFPTRIPTARRRGSKTPSTPAPDAGARSTSVSAIELQALRWADAVGVLEAAQREAHERRGCFSVTPSPSRRITPGFANCMDVCPAVTIIVTERGRIARVEPQDGDA